jgi:CRP-like cAMP-binding protein
MTDQEPTIDRRSTEGRINLVVRRSFRSGQYIFREGEIGDFANVVCFDNVKIVKKRDNQEVVLGTLGKGTMFGELALIDNESRMASARATDGNVELLMVARDTFQRKLSSLDPFTRGLIKILA